MDVPHIIKEQSEYNNVFTDSECSTVHKNSKKNILIQDQEEYPTRKELKVFTKRKKNEVRLHKRTRTRKTYSYHS